jgi:hypothetical protein
MTEPWLGLSYDLPYDHVSALGGGDPTDASGLAYSPQFNPFGHPFTNPFFGHFNPFAGHFFNGGGFGYSAVPAPTVVGPADGLQIDLIWDSSVAHAPAGFKPAIIAAATEYTTLYSDDVVIRIRVGYGEVNGSRLGSGDAGASESNGSVFGYATVVGALGGDAYPPAPAANALASAELFVTSAEAKALGLIDANATGVDGYIGLSNSLPMSYSAAGPAAGSNQYDAIAIAEHEIGEVLGRIAMEGQLFQGLHVYSPLDLFDFSGLGVLEHAQNGGYFSVDNGATNLGNFNNAAANGGDQADWASSTAPTGSTYDAFDAFTWPGYHGVLSARDVMLTAALGYDLTAAGVAAV